jgi:hypothetical protein
LPENTYVISNRPTDVSMSLVAKTKKDKLSKYTIDTTELTRDGRFSILTKKQRLRLRV